MHALTYKRVQSHGRAIQLYLPRSSSAYSKGKVCDLLYVPNIWQVLKHELIKLALLEAAAMIDQLHRARFSQAAYKRDDAIGSCAGTPSVTSLHQHTSMTRDLRHRVAEKAAPCCAANGLHTHSQSASAQHLQAIVLQAMP